MGSVKSGSINVLIDGENEVVEVAIEWYKKRKLKFFGLSYDLTSSSYAGRVEAMNLERVRDERGAATDAHVDASGRVRLSSDASGRIRPSRRSSSSEPANLHITSEVQPPRVSASAAVTDDVARLADMGISIVNAGGVPRAAAVEPSGAADAYNEQREAAPKRSKKPMSIPKVKKPAAKGRGSGKQTTQRAGSAYQKQFNAPRNREAPRASNRGAF